MKHRLFLVSLALIFGGIFVTSARAQSSHRLPTEQTINSIYLPITIGAQNIDTSPPDQPAKLIFIHHSTGENWLTDDYGNLGRELAANNYFVSDTNYGWGPDSIGDRTDIVNWREWFRSPSTPTYMQALFNENGQNSYYTRSFGDPGGENEIVMFKSCFPNSALAGNPNDPPDPNEGLTVGHAKYVYNDLLNYFSTRPDKLFIVITAPPLQDSTYADNARAFNNWLVYDWLVENNYALNNVAVFDFYNVLTHPDNHHRVNNGQIEHLSNGYNTLYYDSDGDDHPNETGSQKATQEFIPLLNYYYHRWLESAHVERVPPAEQLVPTTESQSQPEEDTQPIVPLPPTPRDDLIDDFESATVAGTDGWQTFWDETTPTTITCVPTAEKAIGREHSLRIDFDVSADSWATCALLFETVQDWSAAQGITFFYNAVSPGLLFDITIYGGTPETPTTYQYTIEATPESASQWIPVELPWNQILGVDWEADARNPIDPSQISGVAIGISAYPDTLNRGTIWIDSLHRWLPPEEQNQPQAESQTPAAEQPAEESSNQPATEPESPSQGGGGICPSSTALIGLAFAGIFILKHKNFTS